MRCRLGSDGRHWEVVRSSPAKMFSVWFRLGAESGDWVSMVLLIWVMRRALLIWEIMLSLDVRFGSSGMQFSRSRFFIDFDFSRLGNFWSSGSVG